MLLGLVLALAGSGGATDLYPRVVARAVERAQKALIAANDLEVDHSHWNDPWIVTSEHYEVRITTSYGQADEIARGLEVVRDELVKLLGPGNESGRHNIWVFPTLGEYNAFGNPNGDEHSSMEGSFFTTKAPEHPVASYLVPNRVQVGMWVTHGAVHQFLEESYGAQAPVWVAEGLASYYALSWDRAYGRQELATVKSSRAYVPLERLIAEPLPAYAANPHARFVELGMLFEYLLEHCDGTRNGAGGDPSTGPFQVFLRAAVRGQDVSKTEFAQSFEEGAALLEQEFKDFDFGQR